MTACSQDTLNARLAVRLLQIGAVVRSTGNQPSNENQGVCYIFKAVLI